MPTNISWAAETLNCIVAQAWACACGWIGKADQLLPSPSSSTVCPKCGASGGLTLKQGWHCERVSPGCGGGCASPEYADLVHLGKHSPDRKGGCYAEVLNEGERWGRGTGLPYVRASRDKVEIRLDEEALLRPLHWKKPRIIFWCSMTDWCAEFVKREWRDKMLAVMALTPQHRHLLLTKRADLLPAYLPKFLDKATHLNAEAVWASEMAHWLIDAGLPSKPDESDDGSDYLYEQLRNANWSNVFFGFSAENQACFDERWAEMEPLAASGWNVWCSFEPLLGPINASAGLPWKAGHQSQNHPEPLAAAVRNLTDVAGLAYAVIGGESGGGYRPMELDWLTSLATQCTDAGVPVHVKQDSGLYPGHQGRIPDALWELKATAGS